MAILDLIPPLAFKTLENLARKGAFILEPIKKITKGYAPFPWAIIAHLTYRCNLDCTMCCQHIPDYAESLPGFPKPGIKHDEMGVEQWKAILDDISRSFPILPFFHFSGGEPFLYSGLMDLVDYAKQKKYNVSIITNGWMLKHYARALVELGVNRLHVSIDGPEPIHDQIRQRDTSYKRAIEGIIEVDKQKKLLNQSKPHIAVNCTITKENHADLLSFPDEMKKIGANHVTIQHLVFFDHQRFLVKDIDVSKLLAQLKELKKRRDVTIYAHVPFSKIETYYKGSSSALGKGCGWNWTGIRIHPNGDIVPCRGVYMGNVKDGKVSLREIWNSEKYRAMRRELIKIGNYKECSRCTHRFF